MRTIVGALVQPVSERDLAGQYVARSAGFARRRGMLGLGSISHRRNSVCGSRGWR
jgi:hypothetical protein